MDLQYAMFIAQTVTDASVNVVRCKLATILFLMYHEKPIALAAPWFSKHPPAFSSFVRSIEQRCLCSCPLLCIVQGKASGNNGVKDCMHHKFSVVRTPDLTLNSFIQLTLPLNPWRWAEHSENQSGPSGLHIRPLVNLLPLFFYTGKCKSEQYCQSLVGFK